MARAVSTPIPTEEGLKSEKAANIPSDGSDPVVNGKEVDRSEGSDSEEDKVVVERNGQFLLVSKNELEAEMTLPSESSTEPDASSAAAKSTVDDGTKVPSDQHPTLNKQNGRREDNVQLSPRPSAPSSPACATKEEPTCTSTDTWVDYGSSLSKHSLDSSSSGGLVRGAEKSTPPPQSFTRPIKCRLSSAPTSRSHSAPWLKANPPTVKSSLLATDDDERRRHLNDEAFCSWLARKNRERIQRQKEKGGSVQDVSEEERRDRNARAFQSWLANKQKQVQAEIMLRPVSALPQTQGVSSTRGRGSPEAAYEGWVRRKQAELQSKKKLELERRKGAKEMASKADPQAGEKAFQM